MSNIPRIFIAYAHQDSTQLIKLRTHLKVLERHGLCHIFYDGEIHAGEIWNDRIQEELRIADLFLLLISADFLDSDYISKEVMPIIITKHKGGQAKILPVIVHHCLWEYTELAALQVISHKDGPLGDTQNYGQVARIIAKEVSYFNQSKVKSISNHLVNSTLREESLEAVLSETDLIKKDMLYIKGGQFELGDLFQEGQDSEGPPTWLEIDDYYLSCKPVTQLVWENIMGYNPSHFKGDKYLPVERVSWEEVQEFIRIINKRTGLKYRLPSEAEWEYAAREGGDKIRFGNGKNIAVSTEINFNGRSKYNTEFFVKPGNYCQKTTIVGNYPPNSLGLYDMSGNVWEWCEDIWHDNYLGVPKNGKAWVEGGDPDLKVIRGGCWDVYAYVCRNTFRVRNHVSDRDGVVGFRLALSI